MTKQIAIQDKSISYILRKSNRARAMRLAVYSDGRVVVTTPRIFMETAAEQFVLKKSRWVFEKLEYFKKFGYPIFRRYGRRDFLKYKDLAYQLAIERINYFNTIYNFKWSRVTIRDQKSRWGSCSRRGNLSFNYKIVLLPKHLSDYIIVHELCHLALFNHSKEFWQLVARAMPNYLDLRQTLRKSITL